MLLLTVYTLDYVIILVYNLTMPWIKPHLRIPRSERHPFWIKKSLVSPLKRLAEKNGTTMIYEGNRFIERGLSDK